MAYQEFSTRSSRTRSPLHLRIWDKINDLRTRYRVGWILAVLIVLYFGHRYYSKWRMQAHRAEVAQQNLEAMLRDATGRTITGGEELRALAAEPAGDWFRAYMKTDGIGLVRITVDFQDEETREISDAQIRALDEFAESYKNARNDIASRLLASYSRERKEIIRHTSDMPFYARIIMWIAGYSGFGEMFPDLKTSDELMELLWGPTLHLLKREKDSVSFTVLSFDSLWTVNEFGAVLHRENVLWAGTNPEDHLDVVIRHLAKEKMRALENVGEAEEETAEP